MPKFYITTSIVYTNDYPHIGYALELCQADVLARYRRLKGDYVFFLTGTDEHGQKIYETAKKAGKTPEDFTNEISAKVIELGKILNISNDGFIRTTDKENHWPGVIKLWGKISKNNKLEKRTYRGLYCVGCEAFKTEKELVDGKNCPIHLRPIEEVEEENWFFKLSDYNDILKEKIASGEMKIVPESKKNEMLSLLNDGLSDISFSRPKEKLPWGIPVPGDDSQMIYVWGDALTNYITGLGYGTTDEEKFKKYWPADIHLIGKDILRFHAAIWPAMLLAAGEETPQTIMVHGFISSGGHKMSKSLGNVVSPFDLVEKYGAEAVRYYLLKEIPTLDDGDFSEEKFVKLYNADLANGLGNLAARVLTIASKVSATPHYINNIKHIETEEKIASVKSSFEQKMGEFKLNEAIYAVWELIRFGDHYINEKKPWENPESKEDVLINLIMILKTAAELISPFLPDTSKKILDAIETGQKPENLFPRIN